MSKLPLPEENWQLLISKIEAIIQEEEEKNGTNVTLTRESIQDILLDSNVQRRLAWRTNDHYYPLPPILTECMSVLHKINLVQNYLNQLQYNHTGTQFFDVKLDRSIICMYEVAKKVIRNPLPIKCLEAVAVALYLTSTITNIVRFTMRFTSQCGDVTHKHIVLGVYHNGTYGTVGLSRRQQLMYKPLRYKSIADLILEFGESYVSCCHVLRKVKISSPIVYEMSGNDCVAWNHFVLPIDKLSKETIKKDLVDYSREFRDHFFTLKKRKAEQLMNQS